MPEKNIYIKALEAEQRGDWAGAHDLVAGMVTAEAAWVHAFLHRVEGRADKAAYWYNRGARLMCVTSLATEWQTLYEELITIERV